MQYVLRHERRPDIRFVAIQSDEGRALAIRFGVNPDDPETFLFIDQGRALARSDAVLALLGHVRGPARLLLIGRWIPRAWRDRLYDVVASRRYRLFGRHSSCAVPTAQRDRFTLPDVPRSDI